MKKLLATILFVLLGFQVSAQDFEDAGEERDALEIFMTPEAIEKATAMARECMKSDYNKCGY